MSAKAKTKTQAKTPNMIDDNLFQLKRSFQPAKDREGFSQLTFMGYEHSVTSDGESGFIKLVFSVRDITNKPENAANIAIPVNYKISQENKFAKVLKSMGYEVAPLEVEYDEDGFEIAVDAGEEFSEEIYSHLDNQAGFMYRAMMVNVDDKPGLYRIDPESLVPFLDKEGNQRKVNVEG